MIGPVADSMIPMVKKMPHVQTISPLRRSQDGATRKKVRARNKKRAARRALLDKGEYGIKGSYRTHMSKRVVWSF